MEIKNISMNKLYATLTIYALLMINLSSCKTYFDQPTREVIQSEKSENVERIQFYTERKILLETESQSLSENIKDGKLKTRKGKTYYQVKIPKNTKCIAEDYGEKLLKVKFDTGAEDFLLFKESITGYGLMTEEKSENHYVEYKGRRFKVIQGEDVMLLIKKKHKERSKTRTHKVEGLTI